MIALHGHSLHVGIEGLQIKVSLVGQMILNGGADRILSLCLRVPRSQAALTAKGKRCDHREQSHFFMSLPRVVSHQQRQANPQKSNELPQGMGIMICQRCGTRVVGPFEFS